MGYLGFYINLDRSPKRREEIEIQLKKRQLVSQYSRFPAADGNVLNLKYSSLRKGEIGCFTSHYLLLKNNLSQTQHLHVIEDDVILSKATKPILQNIINSEVVNNYDIIFTDTSLPLDLLAIKSYKTFFDSSIEKNESGTITAVKNYTVIDLKKRFFASTSSFLIHRNSITKLHDLLQQEIEIGPHLPIDLFLRNKVHEGTLRAGCIFPFITSIRLENTFNTTISDRNDSDISILAVRLMRYSFFVECDWTQCQQLISYYFTQTRKDMHQLLLSSVFDFIMSNRFKIF